MKISPLEAYSIYMTVKLHFSGKMDAPRYNFSGVRISVDQLKARKDFYFFSKFASKFERSDFILFVVANFLSGETWIGNMADEPKFELERFLQAAEYNLAEELKSLKLSGGLGELFECDHNGLPKCVAEFNSGNISILSLAAINSVLNFSEREINKIPPDALGLIPEFIRVLNITTRLLINRFNQKKILKVLIDFDKSCC